MLALEIIVAALAAWGAFCLMKLAAEAWLIPSEFRPVPAVRLDGTETVCEIRALYESAGTSWLYSRGDTVFLIPDNSEFEARVRELGLHGVRIIREKNREPEKDTKN